MAGRAASNSILPARVLVWVAALAATPGHAGVALEVEIREPEHAQAVMVVLAAAARHGYLADAGRVGARLEAAVSRPAEIPSAEQMTALERALERGYQAWIRGDVEGARSELGATLARLDTTPAACILRPLLLRQRFRARVIQGLARERDGDAAGGEAEFAALIREAPDRTLDREDFGPRAVELYQRAARSLAATPMATLRVRAEGAVDLFVDERRVGRDAAELQVHGGSHRVLARFAHGLGRLHTLEIEAGRVHAVAIDAAFDRALVTRGARVGLQTRPQLGWLRRLTEALEDELLVVQVREGRVSLGHHDRSGRRVRQVSTTAAEAMADADALVAFALGGPAPAHARQDWPGSGSFGRGPLPWITTGVGVGVMAVGVTLLVLDGREDCSGPQPTTCPTVYQTRTEGWITTGVGAAVTAGGLLWALWPGGDDAGDAAAASVFVTPTGLGLMGRF